MGTVLIQPSRVAEIQDLYGYNRWANGRVFDATEALTADELTRDLRSSFPSILDTLVHLVSAEWVWLERWRGRSPTSFAEFGSYETHEQIRSRWAQLEREQRAFLEGLTESRLNEVVRYTQLSGASHAQPLWELLRHVVNHATYHRGQITTMLRQLSRQPISTDLVAYYRSRG